MSPDSGTIKSGSNYEVTCKEGFTLSGSSTITCTNGQLSSPPTCTENPPNPCNKPNIENGKVTPETDKIESGTEYTVSCSEEFKISGPATIRCSDGTLSDLPSCTALRTCNIPSVTDSSITPDIAAIKSGSDYTIICSPGFTISGPSLVSCTDGQLSTLPTCVEDTPKSCNKPEILHGSVNPDSASVSSGFQLTVACTDGFRISGPSLVSCTDGQLSTLPTCVEDTPDSCNKPEILHGSVNPDSASVSSGSQLTVTCTDGFTISGPSQVACTDGKLSDLPTCTEDDDSCAKPNILDGTVSSDLVKVPSGSQIKVSCNSGYEMSGSEIVICSDGVLSDLPICTSGKVCCLVVFLPRHVLQLHVRYC